APPPHGRARPPLPRANPSWRGGRSARPRALAPGGKLSPGGAELRGCSRRAIVAAFAQDHQGADLGGPVPIARRGERAERCGDAGKSEIGRFPRRCPPFRRATKAHLHRILIDTSATRSARFRRVSPASV